MLLLSLLLLMGCWPGTPREEVIVCMAGGGEAGVEADGLLAGVRSEVGDGLSRTS